MIIAILVLVILNMGASMIQRRQIDETVSMTATNLQLANKKIDQLSEQLAEIRQLLNAATAGKRTDESWNQ